jgi:hypothetical protein
MAEVRRPRRIVLVGSLALIQAVILAIKMIRFLVETARAGGRPVVLDARDVSVLPSWLASITQFVTGNPYLIAGLGLSEGVSTFIAAIYFLVGRHWARLALELLCWLQLTLTPFAAVYAYAVRQILLGWSARWTSPQIALLAGTLRGAPTELFSAVILGVFIAVLRSKSVRRAFSEPVNSPVVPASAS